MKVIIAGSRSVWKFSDVAQAIRNSTFKITEVVSGNARGVDRLGEHWAHIHEVPLKIFPADWEKHGKGAGFIRNRQMAEYADALIAIWDGKSPGTANMIRLASEKGLRVFVHKVK